MLALKSCMGWVGNVCATHASVHAFRSGSPKSLTPADICLACGHVTKIVRAVSKSVTPTRSRRRAEGLMKGFESRACRSTSDLDQDVKIRGRSPLPAILRAKMIDPKD